jgi:hypothetical protein
MLYSLCFETRYDVYMDRFYPQFRRNRKSRPFGEERYGRAWIDDVNRVWREIIDSNYTTFGTFYGPDPYDQFYAAFELFELRFQQSLRPYSYSIASATQELAERYQITVSPGYCMLGAKLAGFELHFDTPRGSPEIVPDNVIAALTRDVCTDDARYVHSYALGA